MSEEMKEVVPEGKDGGEEAGEEEVKVVFTPETEAPQAKAPSDPESGVAPGATKSEVVPPPLREPTVELAGLSGPELIRLAYHQRSPSLEG